MTSTVGLELDLTWKKVSKGNRSGTRRTRKSVAKNLTGAVQVSDGSSRPAEDVTVSESEKHGVAVLGQRFNDKIEHVPIKKRRFVFRTPSPPPSPPQTPSPHVEVSDQHKDIQSASGQSSFSNSIQKQETMEIDVLTSSTIGVIDGKFTDVSNEKVGFVEDFSGIEMLAAAACNDCMDEYAGNEKNPAVEESKQERNDSSLVPLIPLEETIASPETDLCPPKDSGNEIKMDDLSLLPPKDSVNEVKMEDSSLLASKSSRNEVKMKDPSHVPSKYSEIQVKTEESSLLDNAGGVLHESPSNKKTGEMPISLPDDRSLWDLNLSMDAWERPCDNEYNDSKSYSVVNIHVDKDAMFQSTGLQDRKNDSVDDTCSFDVGRDKCLSSNLRVLPVQTDDLNGKENELEGCSSLSGNNNERASSAVGNLEESVKWVADDVSASKQLVGLDQSCTSRTEVNNTSTVKLKEITGTSPSHGNSELGTTNHASGSEVDKITCIKSIKVEESDVASPYLPFLEMTFKDVEPRTVSEDRKTCEDFGFLDNKISGNNIERCQPLRNAIPEVEPVSGVEEIGLCNSPSKYGIMLASGLSVADDDAKGQTGGGLSSFAPEIDTSALLEPEEPLMELSVSLPATSAAYGFTVAYRDCGKEGNGPPSSSDKLNVNDPCNQSHESAATTILYGFSVAHEAGGNDRDGPTSCLDRVNVNDPCSQFHESAASHDKAFNGGKESSFDLQTGYDFEDGELRESDVPCWDEIEQVDYDTEGEEERLCGFETENDEEKLKAERGSSPGSDDIIEKTKNSDMQDSLGENAVSLKMTTVAVIEASESNKNAIDFVDGSTVKDSHSALDGLVTSKRELLSGIEASPSCDALQAIRADNCDNCDDLNPQSEKDGGPEKFSGRDRSTPHMHRRSPEGGPFISHSAGQIHGSHPSVCSRPKSAIESRGYVISAGQTLPESADVARPENRIGRHFMSSHSNGMYRPLMRGRSPIERDDSYGVRMRMTSVRDTSPDSSRFRRYPQGVSGGIRVEYLRRIPGDSTEYFSCFRSSDAVQRSRSGNFDDSYNQSEREGGSDKFIGKDRPALHMRGRSPGGGHFFNPSVGIRDEYIRHVADDGSEYFSRLPSSDALQRNRSDNFDDSYPQAEREGGSDKFIARERPATRMCGRSPGGGHFFNPSAGYWGSKRQHSSSHQGAYHSACSRAKCAIEGRGFVLSADQSLPEGAAVTARPDNRINRHFISTSSNGGYRPVVRRRSPVERDDSYGMHVRMATVREGSPDRIRFRRYPQGVGRCTRDDYLIRHDPDEATEYISRLPHRLGRRERSVSPEGHYAEPYKKTRSRSRSRSPMGFLVQRDRNEGSRRRGRLPDFRADARIDRARLFPKRFPTEYGEGFISPPRGRISPQRNSRGFEDRSSGLDQFRGRKSPVRVFR